MSKGYPDFFGFSVFPQYGAFINESAGGVAVVAGASVDFFDIQSKGRVYDGYLRIYGCTLPATVSVRLTIDGVASQWGRLDYLLRYNFTHETDYLFTLKKYNTSDDEFIVSFREGITFSSSIKATVLNSGADDIDVIAVFYYGKVT